MSLSIGVSSIGASNFTEALATTPAVTTQATGSTFVLLLSTADNGTNTTAPTDNMGNTYNLVPDLTIGLDGSASEGAVWIKPNGVGGAGHVWTANSSGFTSAVFMAVEITSTGAYAVLDQSATSPNIANVTTANSPSITPTVNGAVVLSFAAGLVASNTTLTDATGYNNIIQVNANGATNGNFVGAVGGFVQTTAGATNDIFTFGATANAGTATLSFKPNAGGPTPPQTGALTLQGQAPIRSVGTIISPQTMKIRDALRSIFLAPRHGWAT